MKFTLILLSLLFAVSAPAKTLMCSGTEPFWNASIDTETGEALIADELGRHGIRIETKILAAAGATAEYAFVAQGKDMILSVVGNESCSDGMSEQKYNYSIMLLEPSVQPLVGCCR